MNKRVMDAFAKGFRPEFRNRLDEVIVFHHLNADQILTIVDLMSKRVTEELGRREITLELMQGAKELLAREGYDRQFGARPLRRAVQRLIEDPLAERLLMGDFKAGDTIYVDVQNGETVFLTEKPEPMEGIDLPEASENVEASAENTENTSDDSSEPSDEDRVRLSKMMDE
jgi:ATP-dependent Clp protease ATP-binding subunit ClpC